MALRYDAPALGALDLHFELDPGGLRVQVTAPAGAAFALAQSQAPALREALAAAGTSAVSVTVNPAANRSTSMPEPPAKKRAIALSYEAGQLAPRITATGSGLVAERILAAAREAGVPVRTDAALTQALSALELGDDVPPAAVDGRGRDTGLGLQARRPGRRGHRAAKREPVVQVCPPAADDSGSVPSKGSLRMALRLTGTSSSFPTDLLGGRTRHRKPMGCWPPANVDRLRRAV